LDQLRELKKEAANRVAATSGVVARYVDKDCMAKMQHESQPRLDYAQYDSVPELHGVLQSVHEREGTKAMQCVMAHLLCKQVSSFDVQRLPISVVPEVVQGYASSFWRILHLKPEELQLDDLFLKDLALASGRLYPAAERVVEPFSVIQRSLLYSGDWHQACRFASALAKAGGNKPVFRLHVHLSEASRLSKQSWYRTCVIAAKMTEVNSFIRGVVGGSWFYDPAISAVSPRFAFIGEVMAGSGADFFFSHTEGAQSGALSTSNTRREAFAEGRYMPSSYALFWPRRSLIKWLRRQPEVT